MLDGILKHGGTEFTDPDSEWVLCGLGASVFPDFSTPLQPGRTSQQHRRTSDKSRQESRNACAINVKSSPRNGFAQRIVQTWCELRADAGTVHV